MTQQRKGLINTWGQKNCSQGRIHVTDVERSGSGGSSAGQANLGSGHACWSAGEACQTADDKLVKTGHGTTWIKYASLVDWHLPWFLHIYFLDREGRVASATRLFAVNTHSAGHGSMDITITSSGSAGYLVWCLHSHAAFPLLAGLLSPSFPACLSVRLASQKVCRVCVVTLDYYRIHGPGLAQAWGFGLLRILVPGSPRFHFFLCMGNGKGMSTKQSRVLTVGQHRPQPDLYFILD